MGSSGLHPSYFLFSPFSLKPNNITFSFLNPFSHFPSALFSFGTKGYGGRGVEHRAIEGNKGSN